MHQYNEDVPWQILAVISVITVSVATILQRTLLRDEKSDPIGYAILFQFLLGTIAFVVALIFGKFVFPPVSSAPFLSLRFLVSSVLWAGATVGSFHAIKRLNAGEVTILTSSASLVSIFLGVLFLREILTAKLISGTSLVLLAIWIVTTEKLSFLSNKGIFWALFSAFCAGVAVVNDAVILRSYEAFSYTAIMSFLPGVVLVIVYPRKAIKTISALTPRFASTMTVFCAFYAAQAITYYLAFQNGAPVSQLSPLVRSSVVVTVVLAAIFLKERSHLIRKVLAAILMTIGVILLG